MVKVNANLDLNTFTLLDTGSMNEDLVDFCEEELGITFVARDTPFFNEAWRSNGKTYMRVALPYKEVLSTSNANLLAYQHLYQHLDKLTWMDAKKMKKKLKEKIMNLENANSN